MKFGSMKLHTHAFRALEPQKSIINDLLNVKRWELKEVIAWGRDCNRKSSAVNSDASYSKNLCRACPSEQA